LMGGACAALGAFLIGLADTHVSVMGAR
jgi:hypothetical protein